MEQTKKTERAREAVARKPFIAPKVERQAKLPEVTGASFPAYEPTNG